MRRSWLGAAALGSLALLAGDAGAHLLRSEKETTRFLEVVVGGGRAELVVAIAFGELPANAERRAADLDHDGLVSSGEEEAYAGRLALRVRDAVRVTLDGAPAALAWKPRIELYDRRVGTIAFLAELRAELPLRAGAHTVEVDDRLALPMAGEAEVGLREAPGGRFVDAARAGGAPTGERLFKLTGSSRSLLEDRRVAFRFEVDAAPPRAEPRADAPSKPGFGAGKMALLALVIAAAGVVLRLLLRRARGRGEPPHVM